MESSDYMINTMFSETQNNKVKNCSDYEFVEMTKNLNQETLIELLYIRGIDQNTFLHLKKKYEYKVKVCEYLDDLTREKKVEFLTDELSELEQRYMNGEHNLLQAIRKKKMQRDGIRVLNNELKKFANLHGFNTIEDYAQSFNNNEDTEIDERVKDETLKIIYKAKRVESSITKVLETLEDENSCLYGLENRFKDEKSLTRKITDDASDKGKTQMTDESIKIAATDISDSLRYTLIIEDDSYEEKVLESLDKLITEGYTIKKAKYYWKTSIDEETKYQGINVQLEIPVDENIDETLTIELQFHTKESFETKEMLTHDIYSIERGVEKINKIISSQISKYQKEYQDFVSLPDFIFQPSLKDYIDSLNNEAQKVIKM